MAQPFCIVVVDDSRDTADSLHELLGLMGFSSHVSYDGEEALRLCTDLCPVVMLIDISMPKMDGNELARAIRNHEICKEAYLIAVTGLAGDKDRQQSTEAGFDMYLIKPVVTDDLQALLCGIQEGRIKRGQPDAGVNNASTSPPE